MKIKLNYHCGFSWFSSENTHVKGYLYNSNGQFYEGIGLLELFKNRTKDEIVIILKSCNGVFSLIQKTEGGFIIFSDKSRFFTLFYGTVNKEIILSDNIENILTEIKEPEMDDISKIEFFGMGHTMGSRTLFKNIHQVNAAEFIYIVDDRIMERKSLFTYTTPAFFQNNFNQLELQGWEALKRSFAELINSLDNKQVVVPLSGGFDSRCIVSMLKENGYQNVVCFTYGKSDHYEVEKSKQVAGKLNYKWHFINYDFIEPENVDNNDELRNYIQYAGQFSSMFFLSEYYAVKYLKDNGLIEETAVFLPGHSGDLLGGSQYIKVFNENLNDKTLIKTLLNSKYVFHRLSRGSRKKLMGTYNKELIDYRKGAQKFDAKSVFEEIDIKEKIAKFIINSSKVFPFFNYEVRFPFWDHKMVGFFKNVPYKFKKGKALYDSILINYLFKKYDLIFENELESAIKMVKIQKVKNAIKLWLPRKYLFKNVKKNDWCNYLQISKNMQLELKEKEKNHQEYPSSGNSILIEYTLLKAKEKAGLI